MKTCNPVRNFSSRSFLRGTLAALVTVAVISQCPIRASAAPGLAVQPMCSSSYALDVNGKLYVWGKNDTYGQLGIGNTTNQPSPVPEPLPPGVTGWQAMAGGSTHTLVLANNGQLYAAGANNAGQLGLGAPGYPQTNLAHVPLPAGVSSWKAIAAGDVSSRAIDNNNQLYAWGNSSDGQLGVTNVNPASPVLVSLPKGVTGWKAVAAGSQHTLVLSLDGRLYVTGQNASGQLGDGTRLTRTQFELLPFPQGVTNWQAVACGRLCSFALSSDGQLFGWGYNSLGQLGIGTNSSGSPYGTNRPCRVLLPPGVTGWKAVSAGGEHTLGVANNDQLYAWGSSSHYQLGVGATQASVYSPTPVIKPPGVTSWVGISAGAEHSLALGDNCQLYVWGDNAYGELGLAGYQAIPGVPSWLVPLGSLCSPPPPPRGWAGVTIIATDPAAAEALNSDGSTNTAAFRISRNGNLQTNLIVNLSLSGTAIYNVDYQTVPQLILAQEGPRPVPVTIPLGANSVTLLIRPLDDNLAERNETLTFTIVSNPAAAYFIGQPSTATVTILEDNDTNRSPTITLTYPTNAPNGARFASGNNIPVCATVFDADANAQTVEFFVDGVSRGVVNIGNTITNPATYRTSNFTQFVSLVIPSLGPGNHAAYAQVTDLFGAQATTPPTSFTVLTPGLTPPATPAFAAEPSSMSSYLIDGNGALYVWGEGNDGQTGDSLPSNQLIPVQLALPDGASAWTQVSGGGYHALALANNGQLYAWGYACCGQLGTGAGQNSANQLLPVQVPMPAGVNAWRKAAAGGTFSLALTDQGQLFAWGNNSFGQLGLGSTVYHYTPVPVPFPDGITNWTDVALGGSHTLALASTGALYAWGDDIEGQLGSTNVVIDAGYSGVSHPVQVLPPAGSTGWSQIAAGSFHSLAFDNRGILYGWGRNDSGQVARGGPSIVQLPLLIPNPGSPWIAVAAGDYHTLGLAQDGNIYPWGSSDYGGPTGRAVPLPAGATRWQSISAGVYHSLAVADNCQAYTWGINLFGQLGDGTTNNRSIPLPPQLSGQLCYLFVNQPPSFTKGPDITVVGDSGAHVITNWATNIVAGAPWETNQLLNFIVTNNSNTLFTVQPAISPNGTLSFTLAKDRTGSALVTVVLHDNGGTANGGQDTSAPQTFILTVTRADDAPVVVIRVFPQSLLSPQDTNHTVLATNYLSANVILDASLTTNSAGDPMSFAWFDDGATNPFATSPVAERTLTLGAHLIRLTVSSGDDVSAGSVLVQVITTGQAVSELLQRVQNLDLGPPVDNLLENALESAQKAFDQGLPWVGDVHLGVFQTKVQDHLAASQPALAADFIHVAQEIMDASAAPASPTAPVVALKAAGQGRQHLEFTGTPGALHLVQVSTNLVDWETIGVATEVSPGKFEYADPGATAAPSRFYRLRLP